MFAGSPGESLSNAGWKAAGLISNQTPVFKVKGGTGTSAVVSFFLFGGDVQLMLFV